MNRIVSAIVVTYNRRDKLRRCLEALRSQTAAAELGIIVVDNNSSDGTYEMIKDMAGISSRVDADITGAEQREGAENRRETLPPVYYYNTGYNSGGAGGFCYGIRRALELLPGSDSDGSRDIPAYVWLMDDDCIPAPDALEELLRAASDLEHGRAAGQDAHIAETGRGGSQFGFLTGRVLYRDGSLCRMNIPRRTVFRRVRGSETDGGLIPVKMASFVNLFIPVSVIYEAGLPMRRFFIWTDDWEYTRRISLRYPCYLVNESIGVHDIMMNTGADIVSAPDSSVWRFRYLYRNDVYLYRREGLKGFLYESARLPFHLARIAASRHTLKEKKRRALVLIKGTAEGLSFFPEPERPAGSRK